MNNYPRWVMEDYPDAMKDFSDWMYDAVWDSTWARREAELDSEPARYRAQAETKIIAMSRTMAMESVAERALAYQLWTASKDGWYTQLPAEYSTIYEVFSQMLDELPSDSGSKYSDLIFLIEDFMPAMEKAGIDPVRLMSLPANWSKTRVLVPRLRAAVSKGDTKEVIELLETMVEAPSVKELRDKLAQRRNASTSESPVIESYILREETWFLVKVKTPQGVDKMNRVLGKLADIGVRDIKHLFGTVSGLLKFPRR